MEWGLRSGARGDLWVPKWLGGGDPVNDGVPIVADHTKRGGASVAFPIVPICRVYRNAAGFGPVGTTPVSIGYDTIAEDNYNGYHITGSRYTVPVAGLYRVTVATTYQGSGTFEAMAAVFKINAAGTNQFKGSWQPATANPMTQLTTGTLRCEEGDGIQAWTQTTNGSGLTVVTGYIWYYMDIEFVSR